MKKIFQILFIFLLTACNGNDAVDQLKENHPEIKEVAEQFPKSVQEKLAALLYCPLNQKMLF